MAVRPKVLLVTLGSLGDIHPFLALAHALKREGADAVIAASENYREIVSANGVGFAAARPSVEDFIQSAGLPLEDLAQALRKDEQLLFRSFVFPFLRENFEDVAAASEDADLIVCHSLAFAARCVAEKKAIPFVNLLLSPMMLYSACDPPKLPIFLTRGPQPLRRLYNRLAMACLDALIGFWGAPINALRRQAELPRLSGFDLLWRETRAKAVVALCSPLLARPQPDHPHHLLIAGHSFFDQRRELGLDEELAAFLAAGEAPAIVSFGSFFTRDQPALYDACYEASARLGLRLVALVEEERLEKAREQRPAHVHVCGYAPHSMLFPRGRVVIHHGGAGTSGQALRAGVPQLVIPQCFDQPDNAARIERLGVSKTVTPRRATTERVTQALRALLTPDFTERARRVGRLIAQEDGAAIAARRILSLLNPAPGLSPGPAPAPGDVPDDAP